MRSHGSILFVSLFYSVLVISVLASDRLDAASLQLSWIDNSDNEDGFHIERKVGNNGIFSIVATASPNVTSYTDNNLASNTTYCYRLNAFNDIGISAYTNQACGTTPAAIPTPPPMPTFDFSLTNGGNKSVTQGQSATNTITATLTAGSPQGVSFSTSGLPTGATASFTTSPSCNPTCSRTLNIATATSTPAGTSTITVTGTGGGVTRTTTFTLTVNSTYNESPSSSFRE